MKNKIVSFLFIAAGAVLLSATDGYSFGSYGTAVNNACAPAQPYTTNDCALCHVSDRGASTPAKTAYSAGGTTLTDYFCPTAAPSCTDNDEDGFALEGGECGPVDCNDTDGNIYPGAVDAPNNNIDEDCSGADSVDPTIVDSDNDGFTPAQGDCNDSDPAINPGAVENCSDNIDNNCNDLIDDMDPAAVGCLVCTDNDEDGFAVEGGECGPVDCNDNNGNINPDAVDTPNNNIDEDCSGADAVDPTVLDNDGDGFTVADGDCDDTDPAINPNATDIPNNGIDENCDGTDTVDSRIIDNDGDGFTPAGGDCDDTDPAINPDAVEICTDTIDNNCNGLVDAQDVANAVECPLDCLDADADFYAVDGGACGPVDCNDVDAFVNPGTEEICDDGIDNDCDGSIDEGCDVACPDADNDGYQDAACGGADCNDNDAAINPGAAEECGNGTDENCNGASDDTCLACPDGSLLIIREMEYNRGDEKLHLHGRATAGSSLSIINSDTGEILAEDVMAREGSWEAEIDDVGSSLQSISVISSSGCAVEQDVATDSDYRGVGDDDDDDDNYRRSYNNYDDERHYQRRWERRNRRSWRSDD